MKKIIAIMLTLVMVLAVVPVIASAAPEGTGIASLSEITDMAGKYYLTADITVDATVTEEFTGTLDGNGKTVTVTAPMFAKINGATVTNFKVKGTLDNTHGIDVGKHNFVAAVAVVASGKSTLKDIVSDVNFTATKDNGRYGAIAATSEKGHELLIENCVNNGTVTATLGEGNYAGGVYGWTDKAGNSTVKNCVNNGNVTAYGYCGGVFARLSGSGADSTLTVEGCVNNGNVEATKSYAGGVFAYSNTQTTMTNCTNNGKITGGTSHAGGVACQIADTKTDTVHKVMYNVNTGEVSANGNYAGGVVAYVNGGANRYVEFIGNMNTGKVAGVKYTSQLLSYTNSAKTVIKGNLALGSLAAIGDGTVMAFVSGSSADLTAYTIQGNYIKGDDGTKYLTYTESDGKEANIIEYANKAEGTVINATDAQLSSGEVAFKLNEAIGEKVFRQTIGTDAVPNLDPANKIVVAEKDGGYANEAAPVVTTKPVETTKPTGTTKPADKPSSPSTGDSTVAVLVALLAASAGAVLVLKKKRD